MSTDPSRHDGAETGEGREAGEDRQAGVGHEHTAQDPADPNAGVVRATPPGPASLAVAAAAALVTLILLVAAAVATTGTA